MVEGLVGVNGTEFRFLVLNPPRLGGIRDHDIRVPLDDLIENCVVVLELDDLGIRKILVRKPLVSSADGCNEVFSPDATLEGGGHQCGGDDGPDIRGSSQFGV